MENAIQSPAAALLSVEDVAKRLGVGRTTVYQLMKAGSIRNTKIGQRRLVSEAALSDFISRIDCAAEKG